MTTATPATFDLTSPLDIPTATASELRSAAVILLHETEAYSENGQSAEAQTWERSYWGSRLAAGMEQLTAICAELQQRRFDRIAAPAFPAFRIVAHGHAYASTYSTVAAAEASLREVRCAGACDCCKVESLNDNGGSERSAA